MLTGGEGGEGEEGAGQLWWSRDTPCPGAGRSRRARAGRTAPACLSPGARPAVRGTAGARAVQSATSAAAGQYQ